MTAVHPGPRLRVELPPRPLTLDEVAELAAADDGHRYELVDGNLLVMAPADAEHNNLIMEIGAWFLSAYRGRVLPNSGVGITEKSDGRVPDILVLHRPVPGDAVWIDPAFVAIAIEIVSPGSERLDRETKPGEYARAGIRHYWRVERGYGTATTVHQYQLGRDEHGKPAYIGHRAVELQELLAGEPPKLA